MHSLLFFLMIKVQIKDQISRMVYINTRTAPNPDIKTVFNISKRLINPRERIQLGLCRSKRSGQTAKHAPVDDTRRTEMAPSHLYLYSGTDALTKTLKGCSNTLNSPGAVSMSNRTNENYPTLSENGRPDKKERFDAHI